MTEIAAIDPFPGPIRRVETIAMIDENSGTMDPGSDVLGRYDCCFDCSVVRLFF